MVVLNIIKCCCYIVLIVPYVQYVRGVSQVFPHLTSYDSNIQCVF